MDEMFKNKIKNIKNIFSKKYKESKNIGIYFLSLGYSEIANCI